MVKRTAKLIHKFRVYFLLFISVAFLYQIGLNPVDVGKFVGSSMGQAIGMNVSVPENPINKLALELKEKEETLNAREQQLNAREEQLDTGRTGQQDILIKMLGAGLILLFILVIVNYYLDYKRRKTGKG